MSAVRTTQARGAGCRLTLGQDAHARANASASWSSASVMLPLLAATARRQGSQLAAKNSANAALSWLTPVNPPVIGNAYLGPGSILPAPVTYPGALTVPAHLVDPLDDDDADGLPVSGGLRDS